MLASSECAGRSRQHPGVLDSLAGMIGGSGPVTMVETGTKAHGSLLGPTAYSFGGQQFASKHELDQRCYETMILDVNHSL
jgi:hypothetical protein